MMEVMETSEELDEAKSQEEARFESLYLEAQGT